MPDVTSLLRDASRGLRRRAGLNATAVAILALGIGLSTAAFSVVNRVLIRPLPVAGLDRLVVAWETDPSRADLIEVSYPYFLEWRAQSRSFADLAAFGSVNWSQEIEGAPRRETVPAAAVSASFFETLGARPLIGRTLSPRDEEPGAEAVLLLSYGLWQRRFGGDPGVVGTKGSGGGQVFSIVGVMPRDFDFPRGAQVWTALAQNLEPARRSMSAEAFRSLGVLYVLGRLKVGVSPAEAQSDLSAISERLSLADRQPVGWQARLRPLVDHHLGPNTRGALLAVAGASALVLLLACTNAAVLVLIQAIARRGDLAVRKAVGASAAQLAASVLAEAAILGAAGGVLGLLLAGAAVHVVVAKGPAGMPGLADVTLDAGAAAFAVVLSSLVAVAVALAPLWLAWRADVAPVLRTRSGSVGPERRGWTLSRLLVAGEIALSVVLLVGSGLMVRSLHALLRVDLGFVPEQALSFSVGLDDDKYPSRAAAISFRRELLGRLRALPGVEAAGAVHLRPLEHGAIGSDNWVLFEGQSLELSSVMANSVSVTWQSATSGYFAAVGTRLLEGRDFTDHDAEDAPKVAVISASLARRGWPDESPLGKRIHTADAKAELRDGVLVDVEWQTVVGVVEDARYRGIQNPRHDVYVPEAQTATGAPAYFVLRVSGDPAALAAAASEQVRALDPDANVGGVTTLSGLVDRALVPWRFTRGLLIAYALAALALTASGLFAVLQHFVSMRTREIAIRMAVGARPREVMGLVMGRGLGVALVGVAGGLGLSLAGKHALGALVYGVSDTDAFTYLAAAGFIGLTAVLACFLPARRAARVDAMTALRSE